MQLGFDNPTNSRGFGIKRKPNSNLRPPNSHKRAKKSRGKKYSEIEQVNWPQALSDTDSDYDNNDWRICNNQEPIYDYSEPYELNLFSNTFNSQMMQPPPQPFDVQITPSFNQTFEPREEDSFWELIQNSTNFNPEPFIERSPKKNRKKLKTKQIKTQKFQCQNNKMNEIKQFNRKGRESNK